MNRRELFRISSTMGLAAALPAAVAAARPAPAPAAAPLRPPASGPIPVAFVLSEGAVVIDFAGPWEVFSNVNVAGSGFGQAFQLYTVAASADPVTASGGMTVLPNYTIANAPPPKVVVVPAQSARDPALLAWIRDTARTADLTMSVCTGASVLARAGLLAGKSATTHHGAFQEFAMQFPDVKLKRGARFVEEGNLASAGGLSSGIDLALRVVERYFGRSVASDTAYALEYQGRGWLDPNSNSIYAKRRVSTEQQPVCPVCEMNVDKGTTLTSLYGKRKYYFCMEGHKTMFDASPASFT